MKAALFTGVRTIEIVEVPRPVLAQGTAIVKIKDCGVCGGDIPFYNGIPDYITKHPFILGHEMSGIIDEVSSECKSLKVGDRVAIEPLVPCGKCYACRVGKYNCCANLSIIGGHTQGGYAEYVQVPVNRCHKIPDDMPFDIAAVCEPYSIGANVCKRAAIVPEDYVVVNGAGAVGLSVCDFVKNVYGAKVLITDIYDSRLENAKKFGADAVVNVKTDDVLKKVLEWTHGEGASVVVVATGVTSVIKESTELVAAGGRIVIVGITSDDVSFNGVSIIKKEMTILGSRNSADIYPFVLNSVASGKLNPGVFITHRYPFERIKEAFEYALANPSTVGKVVIEF